MDPTKPPAGQRIVAVAFGVCFGGVGVAILAAMWLWPSGGFGSPPILFRVVASFIAIPFVAMGGALATGGLFGQSPNSMAQRMRGNAKQLIDRAERSSEHTGRADYACPQCAAPLGDGADVSPSGDVKCPYCRSWFNVRSF
ncbi:MAG: hypothetical protein WD875_15010 [Pirellulales bacterium]